MKVKDLSAQSQTKVFRVIDQDGDDALNWDIEPTDFDLIPDDGNVYIVRAIQVAEEALTNCFIEIVTPEHIAETVIVLAENGTVKAESIYEITNSVIPAVASNCFGTHELFYAKENPQVGIEILKRDLKTATNKSAVAEVLGYILRDEGRITEAIEAFKISEQNEPSSEYIFQETASLYQALGMAEEAANYLHKFDNYGS